MTHTMAPLTASPTRGCPEMGAPPFSCGWGRAWRTRSVSTVIEQKHVETYLDLFVHRRDIFARQPPALLFSETHAGDRRRHSPTERGPSRLGGVRSARITRPAGWFSTPIYRMVSISCGRRGLLNPAPISG